MKEQCFFSAREVRLGRGVTVLSRDKTEVSRGGGRRWWMQEDGSQMSWKNDFENVVTSGMQRVEISSKQSPFLYCKLKKCFYNAMWCVMCRHRMYTGRWYVCCHWASR